MATRIVGHNQRGAYSTWNDVDNEEPNQTLYFEDAIMFTPYVLAYPLYGDITAYFYKYDANTNGEDAYPVLYADDNGHPGEKLTESEPLVKTRWRTGDREGWIQATVAMRRTVAVGEKVWFGFFGFMITPRYDTASVRTLWYSWWESGLSIDSPPTERVGKVSKETWKPSMRLSMYFTYSDVSPSVNYVRRVNDIARGTGRLKRRLKYRRFARPCTIRGSDNTKRVQTFVRKCTALCSVADSLIRRCNLLWKIASLASGFTRLSKSRELLRKAVSCVSGVSNICSISREFLQRIASLASGFTGLSISREFLCRTASLASGFTSLSNSRELLQKIASCASTVAELRCVHGIGAVVRSLIVVCDRVTHWRCIKRVVFTLCGVWERLFSRKGVHRVEIVLYSPITLELKLGEK